MKSNDRRTPQNAMDRQQPPLTQPVASGYAGPNAIQTKTAYQTAIAVQVPRDMERVEQAVVYEAGQMKTSWLYSWKVNNKEDPDGKSTVEGETIDAAMVLARNFGNCTIPVAVIDETPTHWVIEAVFIDLETGFSVQRLHRQRKPTGNAGKMTKDRLEDAAFSVGVSKAQRNAIVKAMPQWLLDKARAAAKAEAAKAVGKGPSLKVQIDRWRDWFKGKNIADERVFARIGKPYEEWGGEELVTLKTIGNAIREGITDADSEFPPLGDPEPQPAADQPPPGDDQQQRERERGEDDDQGWDPLAGR